MKNMLPRVFPPFPDRAEIDLYANMTPAREVGGDFYDFYFVDHDHLALTIADVSGKGIPASLFMVISKTLLKNHTQTGASPKEVLSYVNHQLCQNNESFMFCTVWLGILDLRNSILEETKDEAELNDFRKLQKFVSGYVGSIVVTTAKNLIEAGGDESSLSKCEITEFGTQGDYHYFFLTAPADELLARYDEAEDTGDYEVSLQEMKAAAAADIQMIQSELLKQLQAAELSEPVNKDKEFIGKTIDFESVDLDGNAVKSADLFKDNKITMVNIWGTWCSNCVNEMEKLAEIHKRLQEKGCGIVGVECEKDDVDTVKDAARKVLSDNGVTYPNVIFPKDNPIFAQVRNYHFSFFVDSEGKILTYPIKGAAVEQYEPTIEKLLAGEAVEESPNAGAADNNSGEYRVIVYDTEKNPVKGAIVQLCDETSCSFQKTNEDGIAIFQVDAPKVYDVHLGKVPEGYVSKDETIKTLDTFSDVNIFISKAE